MIDTRVLTEARRNEEADRNRRLPIRGVVDRALPNLDAVNVDLALNPGTTRLKVLHPYMGVNSWVRVMPDAGTSLVTIQRGDGTREEILKYVNDGPEKKIKQFKDGLIPYRVLDGGEIEIMSSGRAYAFFGSAGDIELRGGSVRHELLQTKLELRGIAPTYNRRLHLAAPATLGHEERFGVVKRPDQNNQNLLQTYVRDDNDKFTLEYSRWLRTTDGKQLTDFQEGHVIDAQGAVVKQTSTNKPLRYLKALYHTDTGELSTQVDEELNIIISNSTKATETKVNLGDKNVLRVSCQDVKFEVSKTGDLKFDTSLKLKSPDTTIDASQAFTAKSTKIRLNSTDVGFGPAPAMPVALAQPIVTTLNAAFAAISGALTAVGASLPPAAAATSTAVTALSAVSPTISKIASTQVKATA